MRKKIEKIIKKTKKHHKIDRPSNQKYDYRIVIAQIHIESKKISDNFDRMKKNIDNAIKQKASLIIFPELSLSGYLNGDVWECSSFLNDCETHHKKLEKLSQNIDILFGSVGIDWKRKNEDGRVRKYNAAFFAHKGVFLINTKTGFHFWSKTLLPQYREFDDARYFFDLRKLAFEKGCRLEDLYEPFVTTYQNKKINIGISICEDIWDENYSFSPVSLFAKKYKHDFFVNISASPFTLGKNKKRDSVFSTYAKKIKTPLVYSNCFGTQNIGKTIFVFDGSSKVYGQDGKSIICGKFCEEDLIEFDFNLTSKTFVQKSSQCISTFNEKFEYVAQNVLETAIRLICKKWNLTSVVIGVSGGIDSALTSVLFTRVLGHENVYLVNIPTKFNAKITKNAAKKLAKNLKCNYAVFPIEHLVHKKKKRINSLLFKNNTYKMHVQLNQINFENVQARERGSGVLAALSSAMNTVFTCNTNKSEMTVGYGSLYGDLAGFVCPIGDLWKHQVYSLARHYNKVVFKREIIPNEIFDLPPSAELSDMQDVNKGLGDPLIYDYHDRLFAAWVEHWDRKTDKDCLAAYENNTIDQMLGLPQGKTHQLFTTIEKFSDDLLHWWKLFQNLGAIKRIQSPPIIALSRRSFGLDYRESI